MQNERIQRNLPNLHAYIAKMDNQVGKLCEIHYHDELELLLITGGKLCCIVDDKRLIASAGQIVFLDSRVPHWTESLTPDCQYILLQFTPEAFELGSHESRSVARYLYSFNRKSQHAALILEDEGCADAIRKAWEEHSSRRDGWGKFVLSSIYYIMGWLERSGCVTAGTLPDEQAVQKLAPALEYIDQNYGMQELSLENVSNVIGLNPAYFCRLFKRATGHGFTEYLNYVRITKSETLLRNTSLSILDISLEVGFSSVSYYNRIFKRMKNCTPSIYRSAIYSAM